MCAGWRANPELKFEAIRGLVESRSGPVVSNIAICLIHQGNLLLDRLIARLERDFVKEGGLRERMARAAGVSAEGGRRYL